MLSPGYYQLMDLRKWFKKQGKKDEAPEGHEVDPNAPKTISHRRPAPPLPPWAKKDAFLREKEEGKPGEEEVAEEAMIKRPGAWLKKRLGGLQAPDAKLQDIEKTKKLSKGGKNISDQEMKEFLSGFLDEESPAPELPPSIGPGKKF